MAALITDLNLAYVEEVPDPSPPSSSSAIVKKPKRFEIKKWNAVALWAWGTKCRLIMMFRFRFIFIFFFNKRNLCLIYQNPHYIYFFFFLEFFRFML